MDTCVVLSNIVADRASPPPTQRGDLGVGSSSALQQCRLWPNHFGPFVIIITVIVVKKSCLNNNFVKSAAFWGEPGLTYSE